ncbi:hypothetical protein GOP47_0028197 [Adiantum capillus-veneris]|nr:hypothetical protein GOP47_0028197 [Adiantum capillus-veneris]
MASEAAELPLSSSPDREELSTTVDPSYIIQLIRQLLPSYKIDELVKQPTQKDKDELLLDESKGRESRKMELRGKGGSRFTEASVDLSPSDQECVHVQVDACENVNKLVAPSLGNPKEAEGSQLLINNSETLESGQVIEGATLNNEEENSPMGSRSASKTSEEQREEAGCMLWDLAAAQSHAEFMVENHILDVLLAILGIPHSDRLREVCLGILGNLACHAEPVKAIVQTSGLPDQVLQSLFVDDAPSLSEACRLLSASLHSDQVDSWVKAINSGEVLERVMWIAANTMNSLLLEKSTELLLAMVDCQGSNASVLLTLLVRLELPAVLTDLLASEVNAFTEGTCSHGNVVLDTILQIAEALSLVDDAAGQLAENEKLFTLACQVIQLSEKEEVGPAAITATVLVANLLAEKEDLIHQVAQDWLFMKQLLELLPSAADDPGARNAFWSILGRVGLEVASSTGATVCTEVSLAFAQGSKVLLEDLQEHQDMDENLEEAETTRGYTAKLETLGTFLHIMEDWMASNGSTEKKSEAYETIASCCSRLKGWRTRLYLLISNDMRRDAKHTWIHSWVDRSGLGEAFIHVGCHTNVTASPQVR